MQTQSALWRVSAVAAMTIVMAALSYAVYAEEEGESSDTPVDSSDTAAISNVGPYGGNLWDVAIDPNNGRVYTVAKDSPNGFYTSTDGGASWTGIEGYDLGGSSALEINPDDGSLFVVFSRGTYRSTDDGVTMEQISEDGSQALIFAQGTLIMGSNMNPGTVSVSTDNGETFTTVTVTEDTTVDMWWLADGITDGVFYAVGFDDSDNVHLYKSEDYGSTWTEMDPPEDMPASNYTARIAANPTNPTILALSAGYSDNGYVSEDGGSTWAQVSAGSESCVYDQEGRLYFGEMYSDDNGDTWNPLGQDESTGTALGGHNLTIDPTDVNILYVDGMPGIEKSTDRGQTWTQINEGIEGVQISDISQATNKDIVWAAAYNGVGKTENFTSGTPTWQFPLLLDPASAIWANPDNPEIAVIGEIGEIKRTTDGGETWSENLASAFLSHDFTVNKIIADVSDVNTLYAAIMTNEPNVPDSGTVLRSIDMGETWEDMEILNSVSVQAISQDSAGNLYAGVGGGGDHTADGIYKYDATTQEWSQLAGAPEEEIVQLEVDPSDDTMIYAVASQAYGNDNEGLFGFYKSTDSGATWTEMTDGIEESDREYNSFAIQASTTPHTLYLGAINMEGQGVLYKSSDAGDSWGILYTGLKEETYYTMIFDGVTAGSTRGLYNLSSKASVNLKKNPDASTKILKSVTVTLRDAVTGKKLKNKPVKILRKVHGSYERIKTVTTNRKGKATFTVRVKSGKTARLKARWVPQNAAADEYTRSVSTILQLRGQ